jgi:hypothetical protein
MMSKYVMTVCVMSGFGYACACVYVCNEQVYARTKDEHRRRSDRQD